MSTNTQNGMAGPASRENKKPRRNQFGDIVSPIDEEPMTFERWEKVWRDGLTTFHMKEVHSMLKKHIQHLTNGKTGLRIFLPLCGKSLDLKWLADQGHDVVGNEFIELGCRGFFQEHGLQYTEEDMTTIAGKIFKSTDPACRVTLFCCDFYKLTRDIIGPLDAIWDRGSLAAIDPADRKKYSKVIPQLMSPSTNYLVDTFYVDNDTFAGPPFDLPAKSFQQLFGERCSMVEIEARDALTEKTISWGIEEFTEIVRLLKLK